MCVCVCVCVGGRPIIEVCDVQSSCCFTDFDRTFFNVRHPPSKSAVDVPTVSDMPESTEMAERVEQPSQEACVGKI